MSVIDFCNEKVMYLFDSTECESDSITYFGDKCVWFHTCVVPYCLYFAYNSEMFAISSKLCLKNRSVKSFRLLSLNIKLKNPMQKYPHIIKSLPCVLTIFVLMSYFVFNIFFDFSWNGLNTKPIKVC